MHLKSVDIVGFKSFADRTRVALKPGITGVVGPNGCGKTNVMEAIRWCLGEMSWKSLRSPSMVDVIFNGNAKRKALSMAEVTLTFDNSEGGLPVQYSEITVTRRLFRSGESEYVLNRTPCRLRDIRELFLDTGIGGDGYAIIDQGGVDFVLNSKSEDRRSLFEEAAGVAKYRAKREEALRKLERVEADLARLQDSIALINEQIKKLDSDARKAKLYQKYREELTAQEAGQLHKEASGLHARLERETALIEPVRAALDAKRNELDAEEGRLAAGRLEWTREQARAGEIQSRVSVVKTEIGRLQERIDNARNTVADLGRRREADLKEAEDSDRRLAGLAPELEQARAAVEAAAAGRDAARRELADFERQIQGVEGAIAAASSLAAQIRERFTAAAQATQDASNGASRLESELGDKVFSVRQSLKDLGQTLGAAEAARRGSEAALVESLRLSAWLADGRCAQAGREAARDALRAELDSLHRETMRVRTEHAVLEARAGALEAQGGQDPYWVGAQAALAADIPGILGTLRSMLRVDSGFEAFVEDALGERLYALVCEDSAAAKTAIGLLESSGRGRARFLVLSALPERSPVRAFPPQAKPLVEHVRWDTRVERAARMLLSECYALERSLYGEHWVSGGSAARETLSVKLADPAALRSEVAALDARRTEIDARRAESEAKLSEAEESARRASDAAQEEARRLREAEARRKGGEAELADLRRYETTFRAESERLLAEIASLKEALLAARAALAQRRLEEAALTAQESEILGRAGTLRGELAARKNHGGVLEHAVQQSESHLSFLEGQCNRLACEERSLRGAIDKRRAEVKGIEGRIAQYRTVEAESAQAVSARHRDLAQAETEGRAAAEKVAALASAARELEGAIQGARAEAQRLGKEVGDYDVKAAALSAQRDSVRTRLWDGWQLTLEEAAAKYGAVEADPEKIQTLRRRIQGMGNINLAAPEEYEALTERHRFFIAQVEDLNKAKEDLRQAIIKINATTREHFRQTFGDVREHFRRIYAVLFDGGEADLVLTDRENLLETGVDIVAQPPGKRLQSITLLSGGERTLTAIALLFAFFMVKPSPICMLDEADAALDEANVSRFAAMLREFSVKSQFLIVSHNKQTMASADSIYGVTMEESGVSQIISVDFQPRVESTAPDATAAQTTTTP